jgi:hypothetical protein
MDSLTWSFPPSVTVTRLGERRESLWLEESGESGDSGEAVGVITAQSSSLGARRKVDTQKAHGGGILDVWCLVERWERRLGERGWRWQQLIVVGHRDGS